MPRIRQSMNAFVLAAFDMPNPNRNNVTPALQVGS